VRCRVVFDLLDGLNEPWNDYGGSGVQSGPADLAGEKGRAMAFYAQWVHGTSVRSEWTGDNLLQVSGYRWDGSQGGVGWSDHNGLPRGWGATFRGKRAVFGNTTAPFDPANPFSESEKGCWFHFAVPTPVIVNNRPASLQRVCVLWLATDGVQPAAVHVYDGVTPIAALGVSRDARGASGAGGRTDLVDGNTKFDLPSPHSMLWSVGISVAVWFRQDGDITFFSAGADFDI
jgi:hypothetical protein